MQEKQETWFWSVAWKDPLEEGMATHPSILAWRIHGQVSLGGLQSMGLQRVGHNWAQYTHSCIRKNANWLEKWTHLGYYLKLILK